MKVYQSVIKVAMQLERGYILYRVLQYHNHQTPEREKNGVLSALVKIQTLENVLMISMQNFFFL